jgi:intracellular multiplication protein IcmK
VPFCKSVSQWKLVAMRSYFNQGFVRAARFLKCGAFGLVLVAGLFAVQAGAQVPANDVNPPPLPELFSAEELEEKKPQKSALPVLDLGGSPQSYSQASGGEIPEIGMSAPNIPSPEEAFAMDTDQLFEFERSPEELEEEARREALDAAIDSLLPLRPDEIRELLERFDRTQESVEVPIYPNPRPEVAVQTISLDPGAKPAVIKVASGHVTTLSILDISGQPWAIEDMTWAGNFEIIESSVTEGSHIIRISPTSEFAQGNISFRLLTLKTPVILSLETSRDMVHYRFDAVIPKYGPLGKAPLIDTGIGIQAGNDALSAILEGVPPGASNRLNVSGVDGRTSAYVSGGTTYLRTPLTLLSPGWQQSVSSADGMRVYAFPSTPVVILSDSGRMMRARLSERVDVIEQINQ